MSHYIMKPPHSCRTIPPCKGLLCMSTLFQNNFLQSKQSTRVSIFSTSLVISPLHLATCSCGYLIAFVHEDLDSNLCLAYYTLLILFSHISSFKPISSFRYIYSNLKVLIWSQTTKFLPKISFHSQSLGPLFHLQIESQHLFAMRATCIPNNSK